MSTYQSLSELPVQIDSYMLETLRFSPSPEFERLTTVIQISHDGLTGNGEDVTYEGLDAIALADAGSYLDLTGPQTIGEFCDLMGKTDLFPVPPEREVSRNYRRWAFESAALDLALKQADTDLATVTRPGAHPAHFRRFDGTRLRGPDGTKSDVGLLTGPSWSVTRPSSSSSTRHSTGTRT